MLVRLAVIFLLAVQLVPASSYADDKIFQLLRQDAPIAIIQAALDEGKDPDGRAHNGLVPLHHTAVYGAVELTRMLLHSGANPNLQDGIGMTPLHWATQGGSIETVTALLEANADPNILNREGLSPLDLALLEGHARIAEILSAVGSVARLGHFELWNFCGPMTFTLDVSASETRGVEVEQNEIDAFLHLLLEERGLYDEEIRWPYLAVDIHLDMHQKVLYHIRVGFHKLTVIPSAGYHGLTPTFAMSTMNLVAAADAKDAILIDLAETLDQFVGIYLAANTPACAK